MIYCSLARAPTELQTSSATLAVRFDGLVSMASWEKRTGDDQYNCMFNHQSLHGGYSDAETIVYGPASTYGYPSHSFAPYPAPLGGAYSHHSILPSGPQQLHSQYLSCQSTCARAPADQAKSHRSVPYVTSGRYLHAARYLPLRDALGDTEVESQESRNEATRLSEPVFPPLDGFPDAREFDDLINGSVSHHAN